MLTSVELAAALDQLDRLVSLVETGQLASTRGEQAYLAASRDALASELRPTEPAQRV